LQNAEKWALLIGVINLKRKSNGCKKN